MITTVSLQSITKLIINWKKKKNLKMSFLDLDLNTEDKEETKIDGVASL
jgi:hypothetical protein